MTSDGASFSFITSGTTPRRPVRSDIGFSTFLESLASAYRKLKTGFGCVTCVDRIDSIEQLTATGLSAIARVRERYRVRCAETHLTGNACACEAKEPRLRSSESDLEVESPAIGKSAGISLLRDGDCRELVELSCGHFLPPLQPTIDGRIAPDNIGRVKLQPTILRGRMRAKLDGVGSERT